MGIKKIAVLALLAASTLQAFSQKMQLLDKKATQETKNLYQNLNKLMDKGIMFGHQDDLAYGVEWKNPDGKRSDVHDVVNDYPAVFGWDLGHIENGADKNLDGIPFDKMRAYIRSVYDKGGINTISWHVDNPVTQKNAWDNTPAINAVLPGGDKYDLYRTWMDRLATYIHSLKGSDGKQIPIIFRPYHELNGAWFWWGKDSATKEEYVKLFKYTVEYLKDKKQLHNLIYTFSPNTFQTSAEFMERYPGDDLVDMLGFDNYQFAKPSDPDSVIKKSSQKFQAQIRNGLTILDSLAKAHNKIPTFSETGFEAIPQKDWWTSTLLDVVKDFKISYVLVWRNHGWKADENKFHYYAPYAGQTAEKDFVKFYGDPKTLFLKDISKENIYK